MIVLEAVWFQIETRMFSFNGTDIAPDPMVGSFFPFGLFVFCEWFGKGTLPETNIAPENGWL